VSQVSKRCQCAFVILDRCIEDWH